MFSMHKVANAAGVSKVPTNFLDIILRTGTGAAVTTATPSPLNLSNNGGLILTKNYNGTNSWSIVDTVRGISSDLDMSSTAAATTQSTGITAISPTGYSTGTLAKRNGNVLQLVDYVMRQGPRFLQIIQRTEPGYPSRIAHNLGVTPGFIIAKSTTLTHGWYGWHALPDQFGRSEPSAGFSVDSTAAPRYISGADVDASIFSNDIYSWNGSIENCAYSGGNVIYYVFGHDTSPSGRIRCGAYTGNGAAEGPIVNLGWSPRLLIIKNRSAAGDWVVIDTLRGFTTGNDQFQAFNSAAPQTAVQYADPTLTGFQIKGTAANVNTRDSTYLYVAFR